jgi:DNA-binding XRE family transcriptional regulator
VTGQNGGVWQKIFTLFFLAIFIQWINIRVMTKDELRAWRKQGGLKQRELAQLLGVKNLAISRWERGERSIPPFLHLALEALENRMKTGGGKDGIVN